MFDLMKSLSVAQAAAMAKTGINIHFGTIERGMVFYVPPTYVVGFAVNAESTKGCTGMSSVAR